MQCEMKTMASSSSQRRNKQAWKSVSRRWDIGEQIQGSYETNAYVMKKRVLVLVDQSSHSKEAMMWALTHVTNRGDILTILQIDSSSSLSSSNGSQYSSSSELADTLGSLCKTCKPEVEVEVLITQGPKMVTLISQVKKLEVSVLVLGQKKVSSFLQCMCLRNGTNEFIDQCINTLDCLTIGVRKKSSGVGGYLISTRWHKNFWLLA